jgi:signal transduction histidine kinase
MMPSSRHVASRLLILVTALVVAAFVGVHVFARSQAKNLDVFALDIATKGAPRIQHLTVVQSLIAEMQSTIMLTVREAGSGRPVDRSRFDELDGALHRELSTYLAAPWYAGESEAYEEVDRSIDAFERAVEQVLTLLERGDQAQAWGAARAQMRPRFQAAAQALGSLIALNASNIAQESQQLLALRRRITEVAQVLYGLVAMVALALILLASRVLKERDRLDEDRRRLAEARVNELERFAMQIAHDLKGPLATLSVRAAVMRDQVDRATHDKLVTQLQTMTDMIDGLLGFAMAGGRPSPATTPLLEVADEVVASMEDEAQAAGAQLTMVALPTATIACSAGELTSVLSNLLRNAIKYVVEGKGERQVLLRARPRPGGRLRLEVIDTGPGIPPGRERDVFDPLVRIPEVARHPGLGLGLATVKRIVEARRGAVGVESSYGDGSCFWVELPTHETPASAGATAAERDRSIH